MKLGYPRALTYYDYFPFWAGFFRELDIELVSSPPTHRAMMEVGLKKSPSDTCLPIKILIGHLNSFTDVDAVFLPRLVSMEEGTYHCPKVLGLPESVLGAIPPELEVLSVDINRRSGARAVLKSLIRWGKCFGKNKHQILRAFDEGERCLEAYRTLRKQGWGFEESMAFFENDNDLPLEIRNRLTLKEPPKTEKYQVNEQKNEQETFQEKEYRPTIALLGHSYLTYETFVNLDLLAKLAAKANLKVVENVSEQVTAEKQKSLQKSIFWSHSRRIYGAGESYLEDPKVDGIIYLSCYGCGTDSLTNDLLARRARAEQKPYLVVTLDEHTGEAGLVTRLEAFLDMLERRISYENNLPAHGEFLDRHSGSV